VSRAGFGPAVGFGCMSASDRINSNLMIVDQAAINAGFDF
jgi:hypothetical protein